MGAVLHCIAADPRPQCSLCVRTEALSGRGQVTLEIGLTSGQEDDGERALLQFGQIGAVDLWLTAIRRGVLQPEPSGALDLNAVVQSRPRGQGVLSEARAWIVDFQQADGRAGPVFH
jgi:hypothetical protein